MQFHNPIIGGFYSDPSVCAANGKYYMVCSTFHYFPSTRVMESDDLVNWKQIGWCLSEKEQLDLSGKGASAGTYAATIRFHNGTFYVVMTDVGTDLNMIVSTKDPAGKWSEPVYIHQDGIDPSLLFADDTCYFTSNGRDANNVPCIQQSEINPETGEITHPSEIIWYGTGGRFVEGPHLYKVGDWYYLMAAEGGTEYGHMETIARSRSPYGPFENAPHNPLLTMRDQGDAEIQATGHADLVQDEKNNWWIYFHGVRQMIPFRQYHSLGREVFLLPASLGADGWFHVYNGGITEEDIVLAEDRDGRILFDNIKKAANDSLSTNGIIQNRFVSYDFSQDNWQMEWMHLRENREENYRYNGNTVSLRPNSDDATYTSDPLITLNSDREAPTFLGFPQKEFDMEFSATVELPKDPTQLSEGENIYAGLTIYADELQHFDVAISASNVKGEISYNTCYRYCIGGIVEEQSVPISNPNASLTIHATRDSVYVTAQNIDNQVEKLISRAIPSRYLSTEVAGGFTGTLFAFFAEGKTESFANFSNLKMTVVDLGTELL